MLSDKGALSDAGHVDKAGFGKDIVPLRLLTMHCLTDKDASKMSCGFRVPEGRYVRLWGAQAFSQP